LRQGSVLNLQSKKPSSTLAGEELIILALVVWELVPRIWSQVPQLNDFEYGGFLCAKTMFQKKG
jgi:hypothetical protein